jgi:hypothetical protein
MRKPSASVTCPMAFDSGRWLLGESSLRNLAPQRAEWRSHTLRQEMGEEDRARISGIERAIAQHEHDHFILLIGELP